MGHGFIFVIGYHKVLVIGELYETLLKNVKIYLIHEELLIHFSFKIYFLRYKKRGYYALKPNCVTHTLS